MEKYGFFVKRQKVKMYDLTGNAFCTPLMKEPAFSLFPFFSFPNNSYVVQVVWFLSDFCLLKPSLLRQGLTKRA